VAHIHHRCNARSAGLPDLSWDSCRSRTCRLRSAITRSFSFNCCCSCAKASLTDERCKSPLPVLPPLPGLESAAASAEGSTLLQTQMHTQGRTSVVTTRNAPRTQPKACSTYPVTISMPAASHDPGEAGGLVPRASSSAASRESSTPMCLYGTTKQGQGAWSIKKLETLPPLQQAGGRDRQCNANCSASQRQQQ
jgi:hypothetical protein